MKNNSYKKSANNQGSALLITTLLILVMTIIIAACVSLSGMQFDLALLERNTNNTYYLAKSALEKEVDRMNKGLQAELSDHIEQISQSYFNAIIHLSDDQKKAIASCMDDPPQYQNLEYRDDKLKIKSEALKASLISCGNAYILNNYIDRPFEYTIKSDRLNASSYTKIVVKTEYEYEISKITGIPNFSNPKKDEFKITATASLTNGTEFYDTQTVQGVIKLNLPESIDNEIKERYQWMGNPPEIFGSAVTCFSDLIVTEGAKLVVKGDVRVKGSKKEATSDNPWPDSDEAGGIIVSNGGDLEVQKTDSASSTRDSGNIYCMENVATTNGFRQEANYDLDSEIHVEGDVIANNLAIFDDYYYDGDNQSPLGALPGEGNKVRNNKINIEQNVFVDNDVKIDKWVGNSSLIVGGTIFGISDNNNHESTGTAIDPNLSSGIFNQGFNTIIKANQAFVYGQPFIFFAEGKRPIKLYESIGEPFDGLSLWGGYTREETALDYVKGDSTYLDKDSPFFSMIKKDAIVIENISKSYATAYISAKGTEGEMIGAGIWDAKNVLCNDSQAGQFFYLGGFIPDLNDLTRFKNNYVNTENAKGYIIVEPEKYYEGDAISRPEAWKRPGMYKKFYNPSIAAGQNKFLGLRGYMTAMRSIFYGMFHDTGVDNAKYAPSLLNFNDVVAIEEIPIKRKKEDNKEVTPWSYEFPIVTIDNGSSEIDVSCYYLEKSSNGTFEPLPTVIINKGTGKLRFTANESSKNKFKGIIISKGDVEFAGNLEIEGCLIVGGTHEGSSPNDRKAIMTGSTSEDYSPGIKLSGPCQVVIKHNPDIFLDIQLADVDYFRKIMSALKIADYQGRGKLAKILGPYSNGILSYTMGRVFFAKPMVLDIKTNKIYFSIKNMKKIY